MKPEFKGRVYKEAAVYRKGKAASQRYWLSRVTGQTDIAHAPIAEKGSLLRKL
jgi:hypothetical protein